MSWYEFLRKHFGGKKWCVFPRLTERLKDDGYEATITTKRFKALQEEWERQRYGATLKAIENAGPDLFRALKLLVDGEAPEGLHPHLAPAELLRRVERGEVDWFALRAAAYEIDERKRIDNESFAEAA